MSTMLAIVFDDEFSAFEMRGELVKMQNQFLLDMDDAVVVTRDVRGKTKLHQAASLTAAGAIGGSFWGMLVGLLFLNPLLGAAIGAGAGALAGKFREIGVDDRMIGDIRAELTPGSSALFVLVRNVTVDKVLDGLKPFAGRGRVFQTSLSKDDERALREVLETPETEKAA